MSDMLTRKDFVHAFVQTIDFTLMALKRCEQNDHVKDSTLLLEEMRIDVQGNEKTEEWWHGKFHLFHFISNGSPKKPVQNEVSNYYMNIIAAMCQAMSRLK